MTIIEKVRETFAQCEPGTIFTRSEIINMVKTKYGVNESSISTETNAEVERIAIAQNDEGIDTEDRIKKLQLALKR